jgi:hypothetical protein
MRGHKLQRWPDHAMVSLADPCSPIGRAVLEQMRLKRA